MRDAVVVDQLDPLGVDHDEVHGIRRIVHQQAADDGVEADALAAAGGAGDEQVGHLGQVGHYGLAARALAQRDGQLGLGQHLLEGGALDHAAQADRAEGGVGHLDADHGLAGHRRLDPDAGRGQRQRQVVGQRVDALHLDPRAGDLLLPDGDVAVVVLLPVPL